MDQARRALASVHSGLSSREHDGVTYWFAALHRGARRPRVDLVQCYDEAIISYTETRRVLQSGDVSFKVPGSRDGYTHVLLCDGRLLGHWRVRDGVETGVARPLGDGEEAALAAAVARYLEFART